MGEGELGGLHDFCRLTRDGYRDYNVFVEFCQGFAVPADIMAETSRPYRKKRG